MIRFSFTLLFVLVPYVLAGKPVKNLSVTFVGKKFDVESASTVEDVQKQVQSQLGGGMEIPSHIVFGDKTLEPNTVLRDAGINDGSELDLIPDAASKIEEMMKKAGMNKEKVDELLAGMGYGDGKMPSMEESMELMQNMIQSPVFKEYMSDPDQLEKSRQMILNNPMMKSMMSSMPGMDQLLNDPVAWRESMQAAASLYENMDTEQLMKAMMGGGGGNMSGMGGLGGMGGGLFDGTLDSTGAAAALDELSEGDD